MKKIVLTLVWLFFGVFVFSSTSLAQSETKIVAKLPLFMVGEKQVVDKPIDSDLMIAGEEIRIDSDINGDVYAAGERIEINGNINGNLIVAGRKIIISGKIANNLITGGNEIEIDDSAEIGGYVLTGGREINLEGNFYGPVKIGAESLIVGEETIINGKLEADVTKAEVSPNSQIIGEKIIRIHEIEEAKQEPNRFKQINYAKEILSFLSKLIILLILIKLFGKKMMEINIMDSFWKTLGLGLVVLIVTPFLFLIIMATVIGIPLSLIILMIYLIGLYLSGIISSILIGNHVSKKINLKANIYVNGLIGLLLITLIGLVPFIGGWIKFVVMLMGIGILFKKVVCVKC